jgi:hypothetical protein
MPQQLDGVEHIRLANAVGSDEARQRAEAHFDIAEILEALNVEPQQHGPEVSSREQRTRWPLFNVDSE